MAFRTDTSVTLEFRIEIQMTVASYDYAKFRTE